MNRRLIATNKVVYEDGLDPPTAKALKAGIDMSLRREIGNGMLTVGSPEQLVDRYDITVEEPQGD